MAGKILTFLLMLLAAFLAFRWLRRATGGFPPPAPRDSSARQRAGEQKEGAQEEEIITLERDPRTGVYKPRDDVKGGDA